MLAKFDNIARPMSAAQRKDVGQSAMKAWAHEVWAPGAHAWAGNGGRGATWKQPGRELLRLLAVWGQVSPFLV